MWRDTVLFIVALLALSGGAALCAHWIARPRAARAIELYLAVPAGWSGDGARLRLLVALGRALSCLAPAPPVRLRPIAAVPAHGRHLVAMLVPGAMATHIALRWADQVPAHGRAGEDASPCAIGALPLPRLAAARDGTRAIAALLLILVEGCLEPRAAAPLARRLLAGSAADDAAPRDHGPMIEARRYLRARLAAMADPDSAAGPATALGLLEGIPRATPGFDAAALAADRARLTLRLAELAPRRAALSRALDALERALPAAGPRAGTLLLLKGRLLTLDAARAADASLGEEAARALDLARAGAGPAPTFAVECALARAECDRVAAAIAGDDTRLRAALAALDGLEHELAATLTPAQRVRLSAARAGLDAARDRAAPPRDDDGREPARPAALAPDRPAAPRRARAAPRGRPWPANDPT